MPLPLIAAGIGAGLGLLSHMTQKNPTQSYTPDPDTLAYRNWMRQQAQNPSASWDRAISGYGGIADLGQRGGQALAGDPEAVQQFMNPFGALMDPYWDKMRGQSMTAVNDRAISAGGYGGSRHGVAEGQAMADIAIGQAGQRYGEYNSAMDRAGGLFAAGQNALNPLYNADTTRMGVAQAAMGPSGYTQTQSGQGNWLGSTAGGALAGYGLAGGGQNGQQPPGIWDFSSPQEFQPDLGEVPSFRNPNQVGPWSGFSNSGFGNTRRPRKF